MVKKVPWIISRVAAGRFADSSQRGNHGNSRENGKPARNEEVMIERPTASRIILRVDIDPLYEINGRLCGAISVFEDVTDLRPKRPASGWPPSSSLPKTQSSV